MKDGELPQKTQIEAYYRTSDSPNWSNTPISAKEAWTILQLDKDSRFEFKCSGINRNGIHCEALLYPVAIKESDRTRFEYKTVNGTKHILGCIAQIQRLSYSLSDFSMSEFDDALAHDKTIPSPGMSKDGRYILKEPSNIDELYEKISSAPKNARTKDGYRPSDILVDSRSYMLHRTGKVEQKEHPMLVVVSTTNKFKIADNFNTLYAKENLLSIVVQDPYIDDGTDPTDRLFFILLVSLKRASIYNTIRDQLGYAKKKQANMNIAKTERASNAKLFLVECKWRRPNESEKEACEGFNCYIGEITRSKQFANLKIDRSRENIFELENRFQARYKT